MKRGGEKGIARRRTGIRTGSPRARSLQESALLKDSVYWVAATGVVDDDVVVVVVAGVLRWLKTGLKSLSWMTIAPRVEGRIR